MTEEERWMLCETLYEVTSYELLGPLPVATRQAIRALASCVAVLAGVASDGESFWVEDNGLDEDNLPIADVCPNYGGIMRGMEPTGTDCPSCVVL